MPKNNVARITVHFDMTVDIKLEVEQNTCMQDKSILGLH